MSRIKVISAFILGGVIGGIGSYIFLKKKFDKELSERVASIKNTLEKVNAVKDEAEVEDSGDDSKNVEEKAPVDVDAATRIKERLELESLLEEEEYSYFDDDTPTPKMDWHGDPIDGDEDDDKGSDQDSAYEYYMDTIASYNGNEEIYIITQEDYDANTYGHIRKNYVFFDKSEDGEVHVMGEDGDEIDPAQWKDELGWDEAVLDMSLFGAYPTDDIFIRNDNIATDFLVHLSSLEWVPGIEAMSG